MMMNLWVVCFVAFSSSATREEFRFAVSPLTDMEDFYIKIKNSRSPSEHSRTETAEEKKNICAAIIPNSYFPTYGHYGSLVNLRDREVRDDLKQNHPDFYEAHYREPADANDSSSSSERRESVIVNAYKLRNITAKKQFFEEFVFSCVSRKRGSVFMLGVLQYFVSAAYDVNEAIADGAGGVVKIMGRFVFSYVGKMHLNVVALAEAVAARPAAHLPAAELLDHSVAAENAFWKQHYERDSSQSGGLLNDCPDTICKLTKFQKIRLCTAVLNSDGYRDEFRSRPRLEIVQPPGCVRRKLYFQRQQGSPVDSGCGENDSRREVDSKDEWMIPCEARRVKNNEPVIRFVLRSSRAEPNKYYIGVETEVNKTYIDSFCYNVGVALTCK